MHPEELSTQLLEWLEKTSRGECGIPYLADHKIDEIHAMAYIYYKNKRYQEADAHFRLLVLAYPKNSQYWKGLGAALQMKKNYKEAINCYQCAQNLLEEHRDPYLEIHTADCYFALNETDSALKALGEAKLLAKELGDKKVLSHVAFIRSRWVKKKIKRGISCQTQHSK